MSTSNINQLLIRNIDSLQANSPLLVNIADTGFIRQYLSSYPKTLIDAYHSNFADYQHNKRLNAPAVNCHFCVEYKNNEKKHDLIIIRFPKTKTELSFTLAMLSEVASAQATIIIVGENKSGIKTLNKTAANYLNQCNKIDSARHCLLFSATFKTALPPFQLNDYFHYYSVSIENVHYRVAALPGVFSQNKLDIGTNILLNNLPEIDLPKAHVLDFACGCGVIAAYVGLKYTNSILTLADVSALALASAQKTLEMNQLSGHLIATDSLSHIKEQYDIVLSNPPFHQGLKTHYHATETFLKNISNHIKQKGCIIIVANSFLKYEPIMTQMIGKTKTLCSNNGFSIYYCEKGYHN